MNYYNDNDPFSAAWLRELISAKLIPHGYVDERSILEVTPEDLAGFRQCHFFCGIAGWPLALQLAGWGDRPVWTGSPPCQPFSVAGKQRGHADERHLWPEFYRLIRECRPEVLFFEQVANSATLGSVSKSAKRGADNAAETVWLDGVFADLERAGYTCGSADIPAGGIGAPHIRARVFGVAYTERWSSERHGHEMAGSTEEDQSRAQERERIRNDAGHGGTTRRLADATSHGSPEHEHEPRDGTRVTTSAPDSAESAAASRGLVNADSDGRGAGIAPAETPRYRDASLPTSCDSRLGDSYGPGLEGHSGDGDGRGESGRISAQSHGPAHAPGTPWDDFELIPCADGKLRRIEPGLAPLVNGLPRGVVPGGDPSASYAQATAEARRQRLKGYGNAIVPQLAAEFIAAFQDALT